MRFSWLVVGFAGCTGVPCESGCLVGEELDAGLLSVQAPAPDDVWTVGASDGDGPVVAHYDGEVWDRLDTSAWGDAELWWAWVDADEAVFVGNSGLIVELNRGSGELTAVAGVEPGTTFFGVWGASGDDLWAVGQTERGEGPPALWRRTAGSWAAYEDPALGPGEVGARYFKVHGVSATDLWIVGSGGTTLHWDGASLSRVETGDDLSNTPLLTVDCGGEQPIAVGGLGNAVLLELDDGVWNDHSPAFQPGLNGVCSGADSYWAVGQYGSRVSRVAGGTWVSVADRGMLPLTVQDWHGCTVDAVGGVWMVGGRIASRPLINGVIAYQGPGEPPQLGLDSRSR